MIEILLLLISPAKFPAGNGGYKMELRGGKKEINLPISHFTKFLGSKNFELNGQDFKSKLPQGQIKIRDIFQMCKNEMV